MLKKIEAFYWGVVEFRETSTLHYDEESLALAYDWGREWAHRLTLRRWDE